MDLPLERPMLKEKSLLLAMARKKSDTLELGLTKPVLPTSLATNSPECVENSVLLLIPALYTVLLPLLEHYSHIPALYTVLLLLSEIPSIIPAVVAGRRGGQREGK